MKTNQVLPAKIQLFVTTLFALLAFAGNSVLCRLALGEQTIDPASFTVIRLLSGAITMVVVLKVLNGIEPLKWSQVFSVTNKRPWLAGAMLFVYAICFSFAYMSLDTATGALILFAVVQFGMIGFSLFQGYRPRAFEWLGIAMAFGGFILLMLPGASQPSFFGLVLMALAGIAWAVYTIEGKSAKQPIQNTAENFVRTLPMLLPLLLVCIWTADITLQGALLAIASGSITSALGYTVWYIALRQLPITQAAISQLSVPLFAAVGAVLFVSEPISVTLVLCSGLILGGILVVIFNKK